MRAFPKSFKKKIIFTICLLLIIAIGLGFFYTNVFYHFRTVKPNVLYRSGQLSSLGLRMVYARTYFKTDVILRGKKEILKNENNWFTNEQAFCKRHHVKLVIIYMSPDNTPSKKQMDTFMQIVKSPKAQPVLVHCDQGIIRTGMMVAAYRVLVLHQSKQQVLNHLPLWGHKLKNHPEVIPFIQHL